MADITFLLPTNRPPQHARKTIDSINAIETTFTYDICVYSKEQIQAPNVLWFKEDGDVGPIRAFNDMVEVIQSKYIACLVDDHVVQPNIFDAITYLESDAFKDRKFKILTLSPGENNFARIPIKGEIWCGGVQVDYDVGPYTTMRFPVAAMATIKEYLDGFIFHPGFKYHAGDLWLGYFLGINGEPGIQYEGAGIREYANLRNWAYEQSDCRYYHELVKKHRNGYKDYV